MQKCRLIAATSYLFSTLFQSGLHAQNNLPLRNMPPKLGVLIESLPSVAQQRAGLDQSQLRTDIELKLRLAGISVVTASGTTPYLYLNINCIETSVRGVACSIDVRLSENVSLIHRTAPDTSIATTWEMGTLISTPQSGASDYVRQSMKNLVDVFLNDYLSVNPRR